MRSIMLTLALLVFFGAITTAEARAETVRIVALGADNVAGEGVGKRKSGGVNRSQAFPAQLESLLRAQGIDAHVTTAAIAGGTFPEMVGGLDTEVPDGTQLVILDRPIGNDSRANLPFTEDEYIDQIRTRLTARHIALFVLPPWKNIPGVMAHRDPDGHHFTAEGHALIAAYLVPKTTEILGTPSH